MRVACIGTGHFGKEHARVYSEIEEAELIAVCDLNEERGRELARRLDVAFTSDYRELIGEVEAVSVAVPTVSHHDVACEFLRAGVGVLVEKPIARTLAEAGEMVEAARARGAVLQVGHLERFNPAVVAARRILTTPRFFEAHRLSVFTPRSLDVDVVMDLMIHDIDVVLSMVPSPVAEVRAAGLPVLTPFVDICNARVEFENGCVANLTASRVSGERVRKIRFFQPDQYISIDYAAQEAALVSVDHSSGKAEFSGGLLEAERGEPLRLEIQSFLRAVKGEPVEVTGEDGMRALELALAITERSRQHAAKIGIPFAG